MDPDELLRLCRESADEVIDARRPDLDEPYSNELTLAIRFQQLDEWITKRGFLPAAWRDEP